MTLPRGVERLDFDTQFLGGAVWRLNGNAELRDVVKAARRNDVRLVVHRTPIDDMEPVQFGFRNVEVLLTYEMPLEDPITVPPEVSLASRGDADAISSIAGCAFKTDRWHADPMIPEEAANAFKAAWARNSVEGRADRVFVLRGDDGAVLGFNACLLRGRTAIVDLIAVAAEARGKGFGTMMMRAAEGHYYGKADTIRVGTQQRNYSSCRLYEDLGYQEVMRQTTWHWTP